MKPAALACSLALVLVAFTVSASAQTAAPPAPTPPAADAPATTSAAPTRCERAKKQVAAQTRLMALRAERTAKDKLERESCKSEQACKGLDRRLAAAEQGRKNDETRLARNQADAEKACQGG